jgi:hypothetical protein
VGNIYAASPTIYAIAQNHTVLKVFYLMDYSVPSISVLKVLASAGAGVLIVFGERGPCIVHNDVNLSIPEFCGLLYEDFDVFGIKHVAWNCNSLASRLIDAICNFLCFRYSIVSADRATEAGTSPPPSISDTITLAPSLAKSRAASAPIPCPEPVIMAT